VLVTGLQTLVYGIAGLFSALSIIGGVQLIRGRGRGWVIASCIIAGGLPIALVVTSLFSTFSGLLGFMWAFLGAGMLLPAVALGLWFAGFGLLMTSLKQMYFPYDREELVN